MKTKAHGGKRSGAGRKTEGREKRVPLTARVLPETKSKIDSSRREMSVGKFLDKIILKKGE